MSVLPVYFVLDVSASMSGAPIAEINLGLRRILWNLQDNPLLSELTYLSVVTFSDEPTLVLPMMRAKTDMWIPELTTGGATRWEPVLVFLKTLISSDVERLKKSAEQLIRPVVFFLSDGVPVDSTWEGAAVDLVDANFRYHPRLVALGFGAADPGTLKTLVGQTGWGFVLRQDISPEVAVAQAFQFFARTLSSTIHSSTVSPPTWPIVDVPMDWIPLTDDIGALMQSTFISYGQPDDAFARQLYDSLTARRITVFYFPETARWGERLSNEVHTQLNRHDRVILICSEHSLNRPGVLNEIQETFDREARDGGATYLLPIALDDYLFDPNGWESVQPDLTRRIRARIAGDFRKAQTDPTEYGKALNRLIDALKKAKP